MSAWEGLQYTICEFTPGVNAALGTHGPCHVCEYRLLAKFPCDAQHEGVTAWRHIPAVGSKPALDPRSEKSGHVVFVRDHQDVKQFLERQGIWNAVEIGMNNVEQNFRRMGVVFGKFDDPRFR